MLILIAIVFILLGLAMIFARDFMWGLTEMSNQMKGRVSERTELWDTGQVISGGVIILLGGGVLCWQISDSSAKAAQATSATATATTLTTRLDEAFAPYIDQWQQNERQNVYLVSPDDVDIVARSIYYGRCSGNDFYLFVLGFGGQYTNYAYVPERDPAYCAPQGMSVGFPTSLGNGWYSFTLYGTPAITPAASPSTTTPEPTEEAAE